MTADIRMKEALTNYISPGILTIFYLAVPWIDFTFKVVMGIGGLIYMCLKIYNEIISIRHKREMDGLGKYVKKEHSLRHKQKEKVK